MGLKMPAFRLNDKLNPKNYRNIGDINNVANWEAKILTGNSLSSGKRKGQWEEVGYIWFSLVDNTIVPLSRSDEHHQGYDALCDFGINASDYYPIFLGGDHYNSDNNQYPYEEKDLPELKIILLKLQHAGYDISKIKIHMSYITHDFNEVISGEKFVLDNYGREKFQDQPLTKLGKSLIKTLQNLSKTYQLLQKGRKTTNDLFAVVNDLYEVCGDIKLDSNDKLFNSVMLDNVYKDIGVYEQTNNIMYLETTLFGFYGIRNTIHRALRKRQDEVNLNKQLGNVKQIVEMISAI